MGKCPQERPHEYGRPIRPSLEKPFAPRLLALVTSLGSSTFLGGCEPGVLDPMGPVGRAQEQILIDSALIMLAIIGPTIVATLTFAWWFRSGNSRARRLPNWAYSGRIELVTWGVPSLTIILLGGVAWVGSHDLDPARPLPSKVSATEVQVVSLDWKWLFILPVQRIASINELVVPAGVPIHFRMTSASVMNAFFVPQLGSMIYVMNGMASELNLQADQPGTFRGISSHFSGDGFSDMHFDVRALDREDFAGWVAAARKRGPVLDGARYRQLAEQSTRLPTNTFSGVDPALFQQIVSQQLPPGPGPAASGGGQAGQPAQAASAPAPNAGAH